MSYYGHYPQFRPDPPPRPAGKGRWLVLGIVSMLATGVLVWWVGTSAPSQFVRDEDGIWRPRISEDYRPDQGDLASTRVLDERNAPEGGNKEFIMLQSDGVTPVSFSPCTPIEVEINYRKAPDNGRAMTLEAISEIESLTGLKFEILGETEREIDFDRVYSGREPVLISWTDRRRVPELKGKVLGVAGAPAASRDGWKWFISGQVALDGAEVNGKSDGFVRALVLHELGHLVGLDHVDDRNELMYPTMTGLHSFGVGDRSGLAALGAGRCIY